jgi:predicted dithiol-disulfide oxidoreductase (DUF899 family)
VKRPGLENRRPGSTGTVGSNPTPSAVEPRSRLIRGITGIRRGCVRASHWANAGLGDQGAIRLKAHEKSLAGRNQEHPPIGEPIDAARKGRRLEDDLAVPVEIHGDDLAGAPVGEPEPAGVPTRLLVTTTAPQQKSPSQCYRSDSRGRSHTAQSTAKGLLAADDLRESGWSTTLIEVSAEGEVVSVSFPAESPEYRAARDRLLEREIELRRATEAVAAARRELPPGGRVPEDYEFQSAGRGGNTTAIRLSELFAPGKNSLVIYSFMFPRDPADDRPGPASGDTARLPLAEGPCPSCVAFLDQLDGAAEHASQHINLAVVAKAQLPRLLTFAKERGWRSLPLLSSAANSYNRDYLAETAEGWQRPMLNVFHRDDEVIRHFWGSELFYAPWEPGQDPRHVGTLEPVWNLFDLTPEGRPDWDEQLSYS